MKTPLTAYFCITIAILAFLFGALAFAVGAMEMGAPSSAYASARDLIVGGVLFLNGALLFALAKIITLLAQIANGRR